MTGSGRATATLGLRSGRIAPAFVIAHNEADAVAREARVLESLDSHFGIARVIEYCGHGLVHGYSILLADAGCGCAGSSNTRGASKRSGTSSSFALNLEP